MNDVERLLEQLIAERNNGNKLAESALADVRAAIERKLAEHSKPADKKD